MVCSNCKSDNVIPVQGQLFCVNCGNLIESVHSGEAATAASSVNESGMTQTDDSAEPDLYAPQVTGAPAAAAALPAAPAALPLTAVAPVILAQSVAKPARRRPGRPKAAPLDAPKASAAPSMSDLSAKPGAQDTFKASAPEAAHDPADMSARKVKETVVSSLHTSSSDAPKTRPSPHATIAPYAGIMHASFKSHMRPAHYLLAIAPAGIIGLLAAAATYGVVTRPDLGVLSTPDHQAVIIIELALIAVVYYLCRSLTQGAILYGAARQADHRPAPVSRWLDAAAAGQGRRLRYDALCALLQGFVTALIIGLVLVGGRPLDIPAWLQVGAVFVALLGALYLWSGLALAHGFGRVAVTLANVKTGQAFKLGWDFFRRHFMLVGLRAASLLLELLLALPIVLCVAAGVYYLQPLDQAVVCALVGLSAALVGAGAGAGSAVWWYTAYRRLVRHDLGSEASGLLGSGIVAARAGRALFDWVALIVLLAATAAVLPLVVGR